MGMIPKIASRGMSATKTATTPAASTTSTRRTTQPVTPAAAPAAPGNSLFGRAQRAAKSQGKGRTHYAGGKSRY